MSYIFFAYILKASEETEEGKAQSTKAETKLDIKVEKDEHNGASNEVHIIFDFRSFNFFCDRHMLIY